METREIVLNGCYGGFGFRRRKETSYSNGNEQGEG